MRAFPILAAALVLASLDAQNLRADPESVFPQQMTAKDLVSSCASSSLTSLGRQRQRYCHGFVSGVEEAIRLGAMRRGGQPVGLVCAPVETTARQFGEAYVRYASRRGVDLEAPAASVVAEALEAAFPCP